LNDRAQDVWEPLVAIADLAGGDWAANARLAAVELMGCVEDTDTTVELLTDLRAIVGDEPTGFIPTKTILDRLTALEDRPWATWRRDKALTGHALGRLLDPLKIQPTTNGKARGYRSDAFDEAFARYLPAQASKRQNANETGPQVADTCDLGAVSNNASVRQSEPVNIEVLTLRHMEDRERTERAGTELDGDDDANLDRF
jgi:Protein of unknown function (DUF3631)